MDGYGTIVIYEPFRIAGSMWNIKKFPISGDLVSVCSNIKCICIETAKGFRLYEEKSGGMMGHGDTLNTAIAVAVENIATTPDIKQQIADLAAKLSGLPEITLEQALSYRTED